MTVRKQDHPLPKEHLIHFYRVLHFGLVGTDQVSYYRFMNVGLSPQIRRLYEIKSKAAISFTFSLNWKQIAAFLFYSELSSYWEYCQMWMGKNVITAHPVLGRHICVYNIYQDVLLFGLCMDSPFWGEPRSDNYMNRRCYLVVRSSLFKTSLLENGAYQLHKWWRHII